MRIEINTVYNIIIFIANTIPVCATTYPFGTVAAQKTNRFSENDAKPKQTQFDHPHYNSYLLV